MIISFQVFIRTEHYFSYHLLEKPVTSMCRLLRSLTCSCLATNSSPFIECNHAPFQKPGSAIFTSFKEQQTRVCFSTSCLLEPLGEIQAFRVPNLPFSKTAEHCKFLRSANSETSMSTFLA